MELRPPQAGAPARSDGLARRAFELTGIALGAAAGLFLAWQAAGALLLIFAGLLMAVLLDACATGLQRVLPVSRSWCIALVSLVIALLMAGAIWWGGYALSQQADELVSTIARQLRALRGELEAAGLAPERPTQGRGNEPQNLAQLLVPNPRDLFGQARTALTGILGVLGNAVFIAFIGFFVALNPLSYRQGFLSLLPRDKRLRVGAVVDEVAEVLRWWLIGQLATMVVITLSTWAALTLLGMPAPFLLGLQAGLVNFIPYLGPIVAGVPIVLAAASQGASIVGWAVGVFLLIQILEGYILTPLIQRRAVDLQPALTLGAQMLLGALFGAAGIALATPIAAAARIAILRLYVEDALGGPTAQDHNRHEASGTGPFNGS
ncbi:AI-2E family transporter [Methylobacterium isbiliense]|uniref:AI-2E family transporter n=1 Tax=Methylobacterium isbiliense TaxID=315478 RepID=A0ABQ4SKN5_9HYPH|nr:AI-2E family transporter [Methylobacterium isbiliense]MDN3626182.1 AI-2E family transporter [Methylobacterium isbiliense]GJE02968.1 hypothetical protein GMJLKIPL_4918 [Methylobacterium isbiliense]